MKSPSEIEALQDRFDELWRKWCDDSASLDEKAELLRMQEDYWADPDSYGNLYSGV